MKKQKIRLPHGKFAEDILDNLIIAAGYDVRTWHKETLDTIERAQIAIKATHAPFNPNDVAFSVTLACIHKMLNKVPQ